MTHLSMEQLLAVRDGVGEPGFAAAAAHLAGCTMCQEELERLHQRAARLRALPTLRPTRTQWQAVNQRRRALHRRRQARQLGLGGLALAASLAGFALVRPLLAPRAAVADTVPVAAIVEAQRQSAALEQALDAYDPAMRPIDASTARLAQALEDRIAQVDQELQRVEITPSADREQLELWRQRVGLMDALVDVHLTSAGDVGL